MDKINNITNNDLDIKIIIDTISGELGIIYINSKLTINDLKYEIEKKYNIARFAQCLIHNKISLINNNIILSYLLNINDINLDDDEIVKQLSTQIKNL